LSAKIPQESRKEGLEGGGGREGKLALDREGRLGVAMLVDMGSLEDMEALVFIS
jgi:hypothetical protein